MVHAVVLSAALLAAPAGAPLTPHDSAVARLEALRRWVGGDLLDAVRLVRIEGRSAEPLGSISANGRAPAVMFREFTEIHDLAGRRLRRDSRVVLPMRPDPIAFSELWSPAGGAQGSGGAWSPASPNQWTENRIGFADGPSLVVGAALAAGDAVVGPDTVLAGERVAAISAEHGRLRLFVGAAGDLRGVAVTHTLPEDLAWGPLGDLTTITLFGTWSLSPEGIRYPRSAVVLRNGKSVKQVTLHRVGFFGDGVPEDSLAIPAAVVARFDNWNPPRPDSALELPGNALLVTGPFQVLVVRQAKGLVVFGAPQSSGYSRRVLALASSWAPGVPVAAVVVTSGAWAHFGGVREYAARGIPILARRGQLGTLREVLRARHLMEPDSLERNGRAPLLRAVEHDTTIGAGSDRIDLIPNRGPGAEHEGTIVAWLPAPAALFGSDLYRPERFEPNHWRATLAELVALVRRSGIRPASLISIHNPTIAWDSAVATLRSDDRPR